MRRRLAIVLMVAVSGCTVRTETVPGQAAPLTRSGSAPVPTSTPGTTPTAYRTVSMTGSGLSITFPVPEGWALEQTDDGERSRTDATLGDEVLLRIDLTARGTGTARQGAAGIEGDIRPRRAGYTRLGLTDVQGVGDDAVDWSYRYVLDGTPARVIDRLIVSGPGGVAAYLRAPVASWARYSAVWQRTTRDLVIMTS